jgi:Tol biopolymer transport system component
MSRSGFVSRHGRLMVSTVSALVGLAVVAASGASGSQLAGAPGSTRRVSVTTTGAQAHGESYGGSISADGRFVAFESDASNLFHGPTLGREVYVRDRLAHTTRLISVGLDGRPPIGYAGDASISADGRYVAFDNLVRGDTIVHINVFVRDRARHTTRLVSVGLGGRPANGDSVRPSISADGRYVAFNSPASNLVGEDTNGLTDVFIRDSARHTTRLISVGLGGSPANGHSFGPSISADGRYVAFTSDASNLVGGDTNGLTDVFIRDRARHTTRLISVGLGGRSANGYSFEPSISADGRFVAFTSPASNLVRGDTSDASDAYDVFVRDTVAQTTRLVSVSTNGQQSRGRAPSISAHGRFVAFTSAAHNLVAGDTNRLSDVFVRDTLAHTTRLVSVGLKGQSGNNGSLLSDISSDGRSVAFTSDASDLVPHDTNSSRDVFVRDLPRP